MKNLLSTALFLVVGLSHAYLPIPYQTPSTTPPLRKDIDTMGTEEFNLYVLAMARWTQSPPSTLGGFFQVAGIHGAPFVYWDNNGGFQGDGGYDGVGYCFHFDQNFYLWHRPYLALFEQQLRVAATTIANSWYQPQRATYQAAAKTLRLPYWDWAKGSTPGTVPAVIASPQIQVPNATTGQTVTIRNPLYSHTLVNGANLGKYSDGSQVTVGPQRTTYRSGTYQNDLISNGPTLKRSTALLFNTPNMCWNNFATESGDEHKQCTGNTAPTMEGTHNTVHNTIGGTMPNLAISAFDPIFWLHHVQVDRIGAIWQAINPNTKVQPTYDSGYTFVASEGTRDETFQYKPFRSANQDNAWWTPRMLYDVRTTGYTYPEIADLPTPSTVLSRVNAIYGNGRTQQAFSNSTKPSKRSSRVHRRQTTDAAALPLIVPPSDEQLEPFADLLVNKNGSFVEYNALCSVSQAVAPGTSFTLHLFFGDVTTTNYLTAPNRVGGFSVSQPYGSNMTMNVTGVVPITDALLNKLVAGQIKDLKQSTVRKFVRARLVWRLVTTTGQEIAGTKARDHGLKIVIQHTTVTPNVTTDGLPAITVPIPIADTANLTVPLPIPEGVAPITDGSTGLIP